MAQQNTAAGKSIKLFITCVKGDRKYLKFWAVPEQTRKALEEIERFLEEKSPKFETASRYTRNSDLHPGKNVCVKSEARGRWCRARVESNPTQYSVIVRLLDYGVEETVLVTNTCDFDERLFTEHPPLAAECILGDVAPMHNTEWSSDAVKFCVSQMLNQTMCGFVITELGKIPVVRLAKLGQNEPFVQLLINQGLANIQQYEQPRPVNFPKGARNSPYRSVPFDVRAPHLVMISYVDSAERFFVQLSAAELELNNLMIDIAEHVNSERLSPLESPSVNTPCLSPFDSGGSGKRYFRTLITAVEPKTCKVFFVDYGHTVTKEYSDLKVLPPNFLQLPVQAIKCSLASGVNVTKEALVSATTGKHLYCHVLNFNGSSYVVKLSFNNNDLFTVSDPGFSFYNIIHLNIPSSEEVLISYVCSSCEFFCQLQKNYMHVKNIQAQLNTDSVLQPANFGDCIPGAPVCVKYSEDGVWYRAKVLHAENPNSIKVTFVDYGNSETTSLGSIRRLSPELAKTPMQALKCTLSGLESVADPAVGTEVFQELIEDKKLTIEILSSSRETGFVVNLYDTSDPSVTLNTKIKQHVLGVPMRMKSAVPEVHNSRPKPQQFAVEVNVPAPTVDRVEKLYISSFTSASSFFGQLNKIDETKLDEMQTEINELYSAAGHSKFIPTIGDNVCAKFSEDGNFYRAKIEECVGDSCRVLFVDYGNRETVDLGDVHKIRQTFTALPQFGVECTLQSCPSADSVEQLKGIMEENVFEFNMLCEKNGKWIVSLTEDFVSNAPVLEFLRQHEAPVGYTNQDTKQTEDSETDAWGETSDMNGRRQYRGDGGGRRDSRPHMNSDRQNKQEYFSERQRNIPSRNFNDNVDGSFRSYGERSGGATRNFGDRSFSAARSFGGRAEGLKKNFNDKADGPVQNFGGRTDGPKKYFGDRSESDRADGPKKYFSDRSDSDRADGPKKYFSDRSDSDRADGPKKYYSDRSDSERADGPKKYYSDRSDGLQKNFGDRTHIPKKSFMDSSNNFTRNSENSSWNDTSQRLRPKSGYNDNCSTKGTSESSRTSTQDSVTESSKLTDYIDVIINSGTYQEVYVSHIVNPGEFYCQATEEKLKMPAMMEKISHKYTALNDNEQRLVDASVGQPCCAIYSEDGCWYRGKIIALDQSSRPSAYDVFFVDYGNVERVPASKVKCLDPEFFNWSPLARKCALFNILPHGGSWSQDDVKTFMNMALDRCFVAKFEQVDSSGTHLVNLLNINKLQDDIINKDLMIAGHGRLADANKILVINSQVASTNLSFAEPDIREGATEEVIVTWVVNPVEFYCQLQSFMPVFTKMMKDLQAYYGRTTDIDHVVDRPQPGMICVAQYSEDSAWYRAKVVSIEKNNVDVYYVDYGNSEQIPKKKVKYIHQDFTIQPVQGIRCCLEGIKLSGESLISKSVGLKYFGGTTVCTFVKKADGFFYVTLLNDSKNVADELLHSDVVLPDTQSSHLDASTLSTPAVNACVNYNIPKKQTDMAPGTLLSVTVPFIESPKQFWCSLLDSADQLEDLMDLIDAQYNSLDTKSLRDIKTGCGCVAKYSEDNRWYRAVVKNFKSETDSCEVFFVDYGNTEIVKSSEVKMIKPELCVLPAQAIECRLHDIPDTISSEATLEFMKILESEELLAKVEFVDNEVLVVTLLDSSGEDEINVGESIFGSISENQEVEIKVPAFSKPAIRIGVQAGYISHVNDPSDFYVQLEETEEELSDFAAALSEQYECIAETDCMVQDACVGMACCAKFTDDNQWYRAEIIDIIDSSASVLFVDYGNTDVVQVHSLKQLTENLLKKPYAIHCTLAAVKPLSGKTWSAEAITVFEQTTSDTLLSIQFESQELPVPVILMRDEEDVAKQLADLQLCCYDKTVVQKRNSTSEPVSHHLHTDGNGDIAGVFKSASYVERVCDVKCTVRLSYAYSIDKVFVMPVDLLEQLEFITEKLKVLYSTDEELDMASFVTVAQPCVAKYSEDMAWYRALVTDIQGSMITVLFVDFGNSEVTEASRLRPLKSELLEIPPLAIECCLFGVKSMPGKQDEIIAVLEDFVENEMEFEMVVIEDHHPHMVRLKGERDLAEQLVNEELAEYVQLVSEVSDSDQDVIYTLPTSVTGGGQARMQISRQNVSVGKLVVDVKHVEVSNNLIVLHVVLDDQKNALMDLQHRLSDTYGYSRMRSNPPSSKYCVAKSCEDGVWYRAEILHAGEEICYVRFVDFGNCEGVPSENVTELLPEFSGEHQFSISCCMFGIRVVEGSEEDVVARVIDIVGENLGMLKISCSLPCESGMCWGLLLVENGNLNVMQILVEEGLASHLFPPVQLPGDEFEAEITGIETDNDLLLCLVPTSWVEEHEHFHKDLQEACSVSEDSSFSIDSDLVCAVLCDNKWNRGYIMSSNQEEVVVYLIDYAVTKIVSPSSLKSLPSEFCQKAPLVLRCALRNWVFPLTDVIRDKFCETCMSKTAKCKVKDYHSSFEPFYVSLNIEGKDVFSYMTQYVEGFTTRLQEAFETLAGSQEADGEYSSLDNFKESENFDEDEHFVNAHAQIQFEASVEDLGQQQQPTVALTENVEVHKYPERSISNKCMVKLSYVYSSDKIYVTPVEFQDQLDYITSVLKEQYDLTCESDEQPLCQPDVMQPCVAQYAEDMSWYRAVITDIKDDEASVLFVDFGNTEVVECDSLRVVTPELLQIAPVAVECSLFGIHVIPGKHEEINSRLISMLEGKVNLEMEVIESHESPYKVKLKADSSGDISEQFVNAELCEYYVTPSQKLQDSETFKENLRIAFLEEPLSLEDNKGVIQQQNVSLGNIFVSVKYIELLDDVIMLHVVPYSLKDALATLQEKLQAFYCDSTCSSLQTASKFCAAKSSEDGMWYRAQLLEQSKEGYNVKFVDYGNCDIIPFFDVRELLPEFISEVQYSIACCLSGVKIIPGKEEAVEEKIYDLISQTETSVEICDVGSDTTGICRAALKINIDSNDVSHILAEDGLVLQVYPNPCVPSTSFQAHVEEIVPSEQLLFHVIPTEWIEARCVSQNELLETFESAEPLALCDTYGNRLYAAVFDKQWYRVSVVDINEDSVVVNLVDYGKCMLVSKESLQYLETEFCHKPPFVLQCTLSDWMTPVSDTVCQKFAEICHGKTVTCKLVDSSSCDSEPFPVSIEIDGEDIFPSLTEPVGGNDISERKLTSVTSSISEKTLNFAESFQQVSSDAVHVDEDTAKECGAHGNSGITVEDLGNENVSHTTGEDQASFENFEGYLGDVEYDSAEAGDPEEDETVLSSDVSSVLKDNVHDDSLEMNCPHVSPLKGSSESQSVEQVSDLVRSPRSHQASELAASVCDTTSTANTQPNDVCCMVEIPTATTVEGTSPCASVFNESASPAVELTNNEVEQDSSICATSPVQDSSSSLSGKQLNQNAVISATQDATDCKDMKDLHTVAVNMSDEQCTPNSDTFFNDSENDGHSSSVLLSSSVSSHSSVANVPQVQVDKSENMDSIHTKVIPLCGDSAITSEET